jgi:hypothetical protein
MKYKQGEPRDVIMRKVAILLLFLLASGASPAAEPSCERIVAVGDIHGGYEELRAVLLHAGLVDRKLRWRGGESCLVQLGDIVDRGAGSREALDLLMKLERKGRGRVHVTLGNHEVLTLLGDLRYAHPGEFAAFAKQESLDEREAGLEWFSVLPEGKGLSPKEQRAAFDEAYPRGWIARWQAFAPEGRYGAWVLKRPTVVLLDGTLFVHGGISPEDAARDPRELNGTISRELREYVLARNRLIARGLLNPLQSYESHAIRARDLLASVERARAEARGQGREYEGPPGVKDVERYVALLDMTVLRPDGPLWTRDLSALGREELEALVDEIRAVSGIERIVVGHTPMPDGKIRSRAGGRVFLIDTGMSPYYGGRPSALEIRGDRVRAITLDETRPRQIPDGGPVGPEEAVPAVPPPSPNR